MAKVAAVAKAQQERAKTLKEMAANSQFFFRDVTSYDEKAAAKNLNAETAPILRAVRDKLAALPEWRAPAVHVAIMAVAEEQGVGLGKVAQPIRVAVSGGTVSPPIDVTLEILGRETTLAAAGSRAGGSRVGDTLLPGECPLPACRDFLRIAAPQDTTCGNSTA